MSLTTRARLPNLREESLRKLTLKELVHLNSSVEQENANTTHLRKEIVI